MKCIHTLIAPQVKTTNELIRRPTRPHQISPCLEFWGNIYIFFFNTINIDALINTYDIIVIVVLLAIVIAIKDKNEYIQKSRKRLSR